LNGLSHAGKVLRNLGLFLDQILKFIERGARPGCKAVFCPELGIHKTQRLRQEVRAGLEPVGSSPAALRRRFIAN
jgi:hypothetical protein